MKIYLLHIFLLISILVPAQKFKEIKSNPDYIWGEATDKYLDKADIAALNMLVNQISSRIKSNFTYAIVESGSDLKEYSELVINTYSDIYLQNTKRLIEKKKNKYTVLRYIDRISLNKMFENRKDKILDYAKLGILAEKDLRIGDAIRYYYWSISLLKSHPDFNTIKIRLDANNEFTLITFLQNKLSEIFNNIDVKIVDAIINKDQTTFILEFKYSGQKVQNLDYTYWIGNSFSNLYSVKDGLGALEFFHGQAKDLSKIQLKIEFSYSDSFARNMTKGWRKLAEPGSEILLRNIVIRLREREAQKVLQDSGVVIPGKISGLRILIDRTAITLLNGNHNR